MTEMDEPLDFEFEEPSHISPIVTKKKKKVIGLDDLLSDFYQVKNNTPKKESKRAKIQKSDESDDDDTREAELYDYVNKCQQQMNEISTDDQMPLWGLQVFGGQKAIPPLTFPELRSCVLLQSFIAHEVNSLVELKTEEGEAFLEGLLVNGWLLKLVTNDGRVEKCIGAWAFSLMSYSPKEELRGAACEFWCSILLPKNQVDQVMFEMEWLPNHSELMRALEVYGFLLDSPFKSSASMEIVDGGSSTKNYGQKSSGDRAYQWRSLSSIGTTRSVFSTSEVEDLITSVICLFLDRQLLCLSLALKDCLHSLISFFSDDVFHSSCQKIAKSLTCRVPTDVNCLRSVESVAGEATRSKHLRSVLAFHFLVACFDNKLHDEEQILRSLTSINLKDKNCDLFKMYIHLVLAENWLFCNPLLKDKPIISEMWSACLRNCSCQITSTDLRSYASKVRSKASYLLQGRTTT